ncbi:MAG: hypothetical protein J2P19_04790 [Pseudonocardia sp.]|nr:hypothetical protein [Pseudonocardia sp.]
MPGCCAASARAELARLVKGCCLGVATRHGKWLIVALAPGSARLPFHFGMTGSLHWCDTDSLVHRHDRVEFHTAGGLRYRDMRKLIGLRLAGGEAEQQRVLGDLGPACSPCPGASWPNGCGAGSS